ncbi:MAG: Na+/H+ antiporter subunit E [Clostridia bacterium]
MFFIFFLLWLAFNGRFTWEIAAFGVVICGALYAFCCAFLEYSPKKDWAILRRGWKLLRYAGLVITEIVKSNMSLIRIVLNPHMEVKPQLVTFRTPLKRALSRSLLADSITLTPGTITVLCKDDELTVHCLNKEFSQGIEDTVFQKRILEMEGSEGK